MPVVVVVPAAVLALSEVLPDQIPQTDQVDLCPRIEWAGFVVAVVVPVVVGFVAAVVAVLVAAVVVVVVVVAVGDPVVGVAAVAVVAAPVA